MDVGNVHKVHLSTRVVTKVLGTLTGSLVTHSRHLGTGIQNVVLVGLGTTGTHQQTKVLLILRAALDLDTDHGLGTSAEHGVGLGMHPDSTGDTGLASVLADSSELVIINSGGNQEALRVGGVGIVALEVELELGAGEETNSLVISVGIVDGPAVQLAVGNERLGLRTRDRRGRR